MRRNPVTRPYQTYNVTRGKRDRAACSTSAPSRSCREVLWPVIIKIYVFQLGVALGFLLPPLLVHDSDDFQDIAASLSRMFFGTAIFTTVVFVLIYLCKFTGNTSSVIVCRGRIQAGKSKSIIQSAILFPDKKDIRNRFLFFFTMYLIPLHYVTIFDNFFFF